MSKAKIERIERITHLSPKPAICIWFQGCSFKCEGCINEYLQDVENPTEVSLDTVLTEIDIMMLEHGDIEYIIFSGGEPLEQEEFLEQLSNKLKEKYPNIVQVLFTGFEFNEKMDYFFGGDDSVDFILSGRYKGSDNGIADKTFIVREFDGSKVLSDFYKELSTSNVVEAIIRNDTTVITGFSYVE